jgi:hypothetical protein
LRIHAYVPLPGAISRQRAELSQHTNVLHAADKLQVFAEIEFRRTRRSPAMCLPKEGELDGVNVMVRREDLASW